MLVHTETMTCRICGGHALKTFWEVPSQYVVAFPKEMAVTTSPMAPLRLAVCENCWMVQLRDAVDQDMLYRDFWYRSGTNEMMRAALRNVVDGAREHVKLVNGDVVVDIGCNDGTLFAGYGNLNIFRFGFDPARNIQSPGIQTSNGGWEFFCEYFSAATYRAHNISKDAKIVTACAMLYDLANPVAFLEEVRNILHEDGVFVAQLNYLPTMLVTNGIDNASHEHLMYYSLQSLNVVFEKAGLHIFDAELNDVNGGSIRVYARKDKLCEWITNTPRLLDIEDAEEKMGLQTLKPYQQFAQRVHGMVKDLDRLLVDLSQKGESIYAYGASTRGTVLMQLLKNTHYIKGVAERDPLKWGRHMVGSWTRIIPEAAARERATVFLVLPYHFLPGIVQREQHWIKGGGKLLVPVPEPRLLGTKDVYKDWVEQGV